ncbi:U5 small nuclear ribonucleoprotein [Chionoecetes opilio]|uniref:U5 small nuclear ribonucleoprotein 40 kDa protein n=1 Tax=Chionoecetes opilio TaxID=41210 RepID=A0A8J5D5N8_CHIOP|nr:U5 small nuclear ribonucleoprotein [Chionoecetes opilio]
MEGKRKAEYMAVAVQPKKPRNEVVVHGGDKNSVQGGGPPRTSGLLGPIMQLSGHQGDVLCGKFHPEGEVLATAGMDRQIHFWKVYGECDNFAVLPGHTNAVTDLHFSTDGTALYTASADKTVMCWDTMSGTRVKKLKGHSSFVNCVHSARRGPCLVVSGGDDCTVLIWDVRKKRPATTLQNTFQVTAVTFNDTSEQVISGGIDNDMKVWDLRKNGLLYRMRGHNDTVTGLSLSPDGSYVLSNAMDNTVRIWDVRPFAPQERCVKIFQGHQHNFENILLRCSWSSDGRRVAAGSSDRHAYVWDTTSRHILYKLPGHNGSVNSVEFHPKEPIVMSVSNDKQIFLGEIE